MHIQGIRWSPANNEEKSTEQPDDANRELTIVHLLSYLTSLPASVNTHTFRCVCARYKLFTHEDERMATKTVYITSYS